MGFFSGYGGRHAMAGLGRIVNTKTGALSKDARRVVSAFMRGEVAEGNCKKDAGCGIVSYGDRLEVQSPDNDRSNVHVLAKREGGTAAESMEVCIPEMADIELDDKALLAGKKKPFERERSRDIRAASSALLQAVGAGIGVKTDFSNDRHYFSGSRGKSRIAVPGACVRVKFDKKQRELAAMTLEAKEKYLGENAVPTAAQYAKARAAVAAAAAEAAAAKRQLTLEEAARNRPLDMAKKALEKAEKSVKAAEERLFAAREKASALELARNVAQTAPFTIAVNPVYGGGALPLSKKPRKRKPAKKAAAAKKPAKKPAKKKGKK
jgi:hypothetical protein